ncbi:hypothetical protein [Paludisphaera soli]|uniref:hypothetical protein n=1 Tax=Paludisphaera soli TaxID=2712865 RepID=UPI0013EDE36D|nr:hypothetical protein [Paludisphaera soli]
MDLEPLRLLAAVSPEEPMIPDWITTAAYLWLAMLCGWTWWEDRAARRPRRRLGSPVWLGLAILFALLALGKPFGAQSLLTDSMRKRAVEGDWYEYRRKYQFAFILVAGALAAVGAAVLGWMAARRSSWRDLSALAPVVLLLGFLGARATSFHYLDRILYSTVAGVRWNTLIELSLLGMVALALGRRADVSRRENAADDSQGVRRYSIPGAGPSPG